MTPRLFLWIAAKNAIHPFRRLLALHRQRRNALFDRQAKVHTAGRVTLQELRLSPEKSDRYEATPIGFFHSVLAKLAFDYPKTVFIDLGCGMGRTLLLASHYPFRSIIGVEISEALCQIAIGNIEEYRLYRQARCGISIVHRGIEEYDYETIRGSDHVLVYMFNPCGESVFATGLEKLGRLVSQGVAVTIIYVNPIWVGLLENAAWLKEIRRGETFDDLASSFMPYVVFRGLRPPWKEATEELVFQFGPWVFTRWRFASISNTTNPLATQTGPSNRPDLLQPTTYQQIPDDGTISRTLSFDGQSIRYAPYRGKRYFIDLTNHSFTQYLDKFSKKTRGNLKRQVRYFAEYSEGVIDLRYYATPEEMIEFRRHAIAISVLTYQKKMGWAFPETEEFKTSLIDEAQRGRVCGFLLMHHDRPVSYAFCRIEFEIITYTIIGYDPEFARFSPGTVLLFLMLERLFAEHRVRVFDFGGQEWGYKELFATGNVDYLRVIWFPITAKNFILVTSHYAVRQAWRGAAWLKGFSAHCIDRARAFAEHRTTPRSGGTHNRASHMGGRTDASTPPRPAAAQRRQRSVRE